MPVGDLSANRPFPTVTYRRQSIGDASLTCRSTAALLRKLFSPANANFRPKRSKWLARELVIGEFLIGNYEIN